MRNRILLAAVLLVAAFILLRPHSSEIPVCDLSPQAVSSIGIGKPGMPEIRLERKGDSWKVVAPVESDANLDSVKQILSLLDARSDRKLAAEDLSRFGLDKPVLRIRFDSTELDFGILNPLTGRQYAKCGNAVYLVSAKYALIPSLDELEKHAGAS